MDAVDALGRGGFITLNGVKLRLNPLTLADYGDAQLEVRKCTPDPMVGVAAECNALNDPEVAKTLIRLAYDAKQKWGAIGTPEQTAWQGRPEGMAFYLHRMTRTHHADLDYEWFLAVTTEMTLDHMQQAASIMARVCGFVPDPTTETPKTKAKKRKRR